MQIHILASGSDGNASLVISDNTALLIDAGLGPRQLAKRLTPLGISTKEISACFITHEHSDHIGGLYRRSFPDIPIFVSPATRQRIVAGGQEAARYGFIDQPIGSPVQLGCFSIESFATSHDAVSSVGYIFNAETSLLYCTDLGEPCDRLAETIANSEIVIIESNHDPYMLQTGPYPWHLKQRVASKKGHLSNYQTANLLNLALSERTKTVVLAHLSRTNNEPSLALKTISDALYSRQGLHPALQIATAPALVSNKTLTIG